MTSSQANTTQNSVKDISLINNFFYQYEYKSTKQKAFYSRNGIIYN